MQDAGSRPFLVIPAIDLMEGACVRLEQGDSARRTRYEVAAPEIARQYTAQGARRIHVVDLDGAFEGAPRNVTTIEAIRAATDIEIEVGGGIRDEATIARLLDLGVDYVILGTKALEDPSFLLEMLERFGPRIILGADAREGRLSTRGWTRTLEIRAYDYLAELAQQVPSLTVIYTDIARDGMFSSPNMAAIDELTQIPNLELIASGGVGSLDDILRLRAMNKPNLRGVVVGKALYDGRVSLAEAIALTQS